MDISDICFSVPVSSVWNGVSGSVQHRPGTWLVIRAGLRLCVETPPSVIGLPSATFSSAGAFSTSLRYFGVCTAVNFLILGHGSLGCCFSSVLCVCVCLWSFSCPSSTLGFLSRLSLLQGKDLSKCLIGIRTIVRSQKSWYVFICHSDI